MKDNMYEELYRRINKLEKSNESINKKLDLIIQRIDDLYDDDDDYDDDEPGWDWI